MRFATLLLTACGGNLPQATPPAPETRPAVQTAADDVPLYADPATAARYNAAPATFRRYGDGLLPEEDLPSCFDTLTLIRPSVNNPGFFAETFTPALDCDSPDIARSGDWSFECKYEVGRSSPFLEDGADYGYIRVGTCAGMNCIMGQMAEETRLACDASRESFDLYHCGNMRALNGGRGFDGTVY